MRSRISGKQFGFIKGVETRDAMFSLVYRYSEMNWDTLVCFAVYQKAFDKIQCQKIIRELKDIQAMLRRYIQDVRKLKNWNSFQR